jgi:hypothetical protein
MESVSRGRKEKRNDKVEADAGEGRPSQLHLVIHSSSRHAVLNEHDEDCLTPF